MQLFVEPEQNDSELQEDRLKAAQAH